MCQYFLYPLNPATPSEVPAVQCHERGLAWRSYDRKRGVRGEPRQRVGMTLVNSFVLAERKPELVSSRNMTVLLGKIDRLGQAVHWNAHRIDMTVIDTTTARDVLK